MQNPKNLRVASAAEELAVSVYDLTATYPRDERFGLVAQMRRAAVSIGSNISEGCGRQGNRSLVAFLYIAYGSAAELEFQLRLATRFKYGDAVLSEQLAAALIRFRRSLSSLVRSLETRER